MVDEEHVVLAVVAQGERAVVDGLADAEELHALLGEEAFHFAALLIGHLDDEGRILGKENLDEVFLVESVEQHVESALAVGECHLEQGGDETTGTHIVSGKQQLVVNKLLYGIERSCKIGGVRHLRSLVAHKSQ